MQIRVFGVCNKNQTISCHSLENLGFDVKLPLPCKNTMGISQSLEKIQVEALYNMFQKVACLKVQFVSFGEKP